MNELAITGIGSLTPAGPGWAGLTPESSLAPTPVPSLRQPGKSLATLAVKDETLQRWAGEPRLRRASRITLLMAAAAHQALASARVAPGRLGIVGAFFTGPCHHSRLFFQPVIERGASFASPALFPETVYNSCLSHLADLLGVDGACYAVVGDDSAWVTAIQTASVWLDLGVADSVLVIAGEELDASALEAYAAAGWLAGDFVPAEGAAALLVSRPDEGSAATISGLPGGFGYRSRASARQAVGACFAAMTAAPIATTGGATWMAALERAARAAGGIPLAEPGLGHAFTATAGGNTLRALRWLRAHPGHDQLWVPVWGLHHQVSALRIHRKNCDRLAVFEDTR